MNYDREIIRILTEAGEEGLALRNISRHVHNACNSFFAPVDFDTVHDYVGKFLLRQARDPQSLIERLPGRGCYRLNAKSLEGQQLMLRFSDGSATDSEKETTQDIDLSLSLFD